ncbi:MAG: 2-oxo acid dehydrogenase subunit E2 [Acidimicrobiia bacterium]|nr:2-oxo acid dehydrogenase subunit E2 [Acidimicrobiia bacterium]MDH3463253.1 2-oxo acid dehydrogenase subunit E2 [Acidimicrobiia bacterium]
MSTTVAMPQLGETVTEGTILKWAKQVGDTIAEDEVLVEISTDKVDTEVPSPAAGTILEILVEEGDTVEVGTPLVVIGEAGEVPPEDFSSEPETPPAATAPEPTEVESPVPAAATQADPEPQEVTPPAPADTKPTAAEVDAFFAEPDETESQPRLLSPVVRKLIRENDVNLSAISGTGQGGRVTRRDVEAYLEAAPAPPGAASLETPATAAPEPAAAASTPAPAPETHTSPPRPIATTTAEGEEVELDRIRVRIGENMAKAKQSAAHVWTSVEVDFEKVERVRKAHKAAFKAAEGFSLTYLPFISRAVIDALKAYPVVNSSFYLEEKKAVFHKNVNLGIAIDLNEKGLVVGSVRNADGLRMVGLARSVRDLAEKARGKGLDLDDITGSTFTITNPGPFGSFMSAPIINVPNVAILSTDTVTKRPTVVTTADGQDMIAIRHIGYLGLSWDHRAFDGSTAVLFLRKIKENLETWDWEQELS